VVRDPSLTALAGRYLYGDLCTGRLRTLDLANVSSDRELSTDVAAPVGSLVSFGEDSRGGLYAVSQSGTIYRIAG